MATLLLDPYLEQKCREEYPERITETWNGIDVMGPLPNNEHQELQLALSIPLFEVVQSVHLGVVYLGANVARQHQNWRSVYRGPDVAVYLTGNPAVNRGSHWVGGPDFLVEIISDGEDPHAKFDFYARVNTREVLVVERNPWVVELFTLVNGVLVSAGRSDVANGLVLTSTALGLTFRLVDGTPRPRIEMTHPASAKRWVA